MKLRSADHKKLWSTSGGMCAYPNCTQALSQISPTSGKTVTIGEEAHIRAEASTPGDFDLPLAKSEIRGPFTQKHFEILTKPWRELFTLRELDNYLTIAGQADRLDLYFRGLK